nr:nephrocystin-3 [Quercus suber]
MHDQAALSAEISFTSEASRIANQIAQLTINGDQHNYSVSEAAARGMKGSSRCVSVPFTTVSTYTEREHLSNELKQKLGRPYNGHMLAHAVALTGLGGTGKTQLVLRYLEKHEHEYDTILWLDARSLETVRSSFERCRHALGLSENGASQAMLQDTPTVQAVLQWLRGRLPEQKWLVVVDNVDDLSWNVSSIIPHGRAGSVIVTSQDSQASRLLGGKSEIVRAEIMTIKEAVTLLRDTIGEFEEADESSDCAMLLEQIVSDLDGLPLAIDLAGARINAEVIDGEAVEDAMRRYIVDFKQNRARLLKSSDYAHASPSRKTVWTVWETSLSSIQQIDESQPDGSSLDLLELMTFLDRTNIQEELFRLASEGMKDLCSWMWNRVPPRLQKVLSLGRNGEWNDFYYRQAVGPLRRYGFVRSVRSSSKGLTMHSLVQWRASQQADHEKVWACYTSFITAVASKMLSESEQMQSRRNVVEHLPANGKLLAPEQEYSEQTPRQSQEEKASSDVDQTHFALMWTIIGRLWQSEGRWTESEQLFFAAYQSRLRVLGAEHKSTLIAMCNLALIYCEQGRWKEAEELQIQTLEISSSILGEEHSDTLTYMDNLASTYWNQGRLKEAEALQAKTRNASSRALGDNDRRTLIATANLAMTYLNQGRWDEAEELQVKLMETRSRILGDRHMDTLLAMGNLASIYWQQGSLEKAEELEVKRIEGLSGVLSEEHPNMLMAKSNLATIYSAQGRYEMASELEVRMMELSSRIFGPDHPHTLTIAGNLSVTYENQDRWKEAEELKETVMQARLRTLGKEHPDTLLSSASVALMYSRQERYLEAYEIEAETVELSTKVLGEQHPNTVTAMGNHAATLKGLGRRDDAIDLITRTLALSSEVLGDDHPDCIQHREWLKSWT